MLDVHQITLHQDDERQLKCKWLLLLLFVTKSMTTATETETETSDDKFITVR